MSSLEQKDEFSIQRKSESSQTYYEYFKCYTSTLHGHAQALGLDTLVFEVVR